MPEMIYKAYSCQTKTVDAEAGIYEVMPSTESVDRDGDILIAAGAVLDPFRRNPVVLWAHDYRSLPVAKALSIEAIAGKGLKATIQFSPRGQNARADDVHAAWATGFLNAASVGFVPLAPPQERVPAEGEPQRRFGPGVIFTSWELLEFSLVPVPANADALRLAYGGKRDGMLSAAEEAKIRTARDYLDAVLASAAEQPEEDAAGDAHEKAAIPPHTSPKADPDTGWDGPASVAACPAERGALRRMHAWVDSKGDPDAKQSYKLPHHLPDGRVVLRGVNNAMSRLPQSSIPDGDRAGVERHLKHHQDQFKGATIDDKSDGVTGNEPWWTDLLAAIDDLGGIYNAER